MLDYHGDSVALSEFISALSAANFPDPAVARAQHNALEGVATESESALLGAFVHHLLSHAASDGTELALLQRAADLWDRGTALCTELGAIRADLEGAMEDPGAPGQLTASTPQPSVLRTSRTRPTRCAWRSTPSELTCWHSRTCRPIRASRTGGRTPGTGAT